MGNLWSLQKKLLPLQQGTRTQEDEATVRFCRIHKENPAAKHAAGQSKQKQQNLFSSSYIQTASRMNSIMIANTILKNISNINIMSPFISIFCTYSLDLKHNSLIRWVEPQISELVTYTLNGCDAAMISFILSLLPKQPLV